MSDTVLQTMPLGFQWPTTDPFLFCVHHLDTYPNGNEQLGPEHTLRGRELGNDFAGIDGWRMYHGTVVPGFPQHPHRGFETVTFVRQGYIDHSDSLGATARFGRGDTQWLTAGKGIVHSEMFPLLEREQPNPTELFQIWINLPAEDKFAEPYFAMLWDEDVPHVEHRDAEGRAVLITVIAGELEGHRPPPPPPNSWASRPEADVAIWHLHLAAESRWTIPAARSSDAVRTLFFYEGTRLSIDDDVIEAATGAVVRCDRSVELHARGGPAEILVLQGKPIAEPVAQYGPFVLNDREGVVQAFDDYQRTGFGGWPWPADDPVHTADRGRFARHADGRVEERAEPSRRSGISSS